MGEFAIAPFRCDITPPLGHALLGGWIPSARAVDDSLEAIGYVLLGGGAPIVVCALDWAGVMNDAHVSWRTALADAAGTTPDRVAVHCVHQHNTPFVCPIARGAAARHPDLPEMFDAAFFETCVRGAQDAVRQAVSSARHVSHVGHARTKVEHVASNRRVGRDPYGRVTAMRRSSCTDPALLALPDGLIDPYLQTLAFYDANGSPLVVCHYYATHPMSFYEDGRVTSDFCGLARKRRQREDSGCTRIYFTGCAGDVSAGKYNDGSPASRIALTNRMYAAMRASEQALVPQPLATLDWATEEVLPTPQPWPSVTELEAAIADRGGTLVSRLLAAFRLGWIRRVERGVPLVLSRLRLNELFVLHLPGEMFVEYQLRAQALRPENAVLVAAYGDGGPWYIPTKAEYPAGGYEVSVAFCRDDVDPLLTEAIRRLIA